MSAPLETHVPGEASAVNAVARWIRDAESDGLGRAEELAAEARREATDLWESRAGSSYRGEVRTFHGDVEALRPTFTRAAEIVEDYGIELTSVKNAMERVRERAREGDLDVAEYWINPPVQPQPLSEEVMFLGDSPDNPYREDFLAHQEAMEKVRLFEELRVDAHRIREAFDQYVESSLTPMTEHLGVDDKVGWRGDIGPVGRFGVGVGEKAARGAVEAVTGLPDIPKHLLRVGETGYNLIDAAVESGRTGDPGPILEAAASETTSRGIDAATQLLKKTPVQIAVGAVANETADTATGALIDGATGDAPLPPAPEREGPPMLAEPQR